MPRWQLSPGLSCSLETNGTYEKYYVSSGEWDVKIKDVMYPDNFPEDEARAFLRGIGDETLKAKLLEQINWSFSNTKEKAIEVYFFGIGIATYKDGQIVLKL